MPFFCKRGPLHIIRHHACVAFSCATVLMYDDAPQGAYGFRQPAIIGGISIHAALLGHGELIDGPFWTRAIGRKSNWDDGTSYYTCGQTGMEK
jgi:hypothetical protein